MSERELSSEQKAKILHAELAVDLPKLDLHGVDMRDDVESLLDRFLVENFNNKQDVAEVVYGIGEGKMEKRVLEFLEKHPMVEHVGKGSGHCRVILGV